MNTVQEMYIKDSVKMLQDIIKYDKEGYYAEKDLKGQIVFVLNHLKKSLK